MISINTVRLGEHLPLLDLLPAAAPIAWVRGGDGLVGWGVHATTTVSGPNRFNDARTWWLNNLKHFQLPMLSMSAELGQFYFRLFRFPNPKNQF